MGLFTLLARRWATKNRRRRATRIEADTFAPRRLERRRVLDAAGAELVLGVVTDSSETVQAAGLVEDTSDATTTPTSVVIPNSPPTLTDIYVFPDSSTVEGGDDVFVLVLFGDLDGGDTHTVDINWGDGTDVQTYDVTPGFRYLYVSHQFQDDSPTGTPVDVALIDVTVNDSQGGSVNGSASITVSNVAPTLDTLSITPTVDENGLVTLSGTFSDPGTLDTFELDIDWDGDSVYDETVAVSGGSFSIDYQILDDDPSGTSSDSFDVNVRLRDDDTGFDTGMVSYTVNNVAPVIDTLSITSPINEDGTATLSGTFTDPGSLDTFELDIDWDGDNVYDETIVVSGGSFMATHQYLDDDPSGTTSDTFNVNVRLSDDDGGEATDQVSLTVANVAPVIDTLSITSPINEDGTATLSGAFTDPGSLDTFELDIDWDGDNVYDETIVVSGGSFMATHQYLDDDPSGTTSDTFNVNVRLSDDDGGEAADSVSLTIENVAPTVTVAADQVVNEGAELDLSSGGLGSFTDPGTLDTHTATVDWGDGTGIEAVAVTQMGGSGTLSASHTFADDGIYTVTVTVMDDDGGSTSEQFTVTVNNVAPTLDSIPDITTDEGTFISLPPATFTDPGFDLAAAGTEENFTATIDWGDGTTEPVGDITLTEVAGSEGVLTTGTINAMHAYADDGMYTVTVTVMDDNGGSATQQFTVTVNNVAPTLDSIPDITTDEGTFISLPPATFTDPGFDLAAAGTEENFTATIDWGDGTTEPVGDITLTEVAGSEGVLTTGTINAMHAYADDGMYTVTVTVMDDNGGSATQQFTVTVNNVAPTLDSIPDITTDEGTFISLPPATFTDPGFDLSAAGTEENFTATIDWGDGTTEPVGDITLTEVAGSEGVLTTGTINAMHAYADDGMYTVTVTVMDDNGGSATQQFTVKVNNVAPILTGTDEALEVDEGEEFTLNDLGVGLSDPGFDNPLNPLPGGELEETFTGVTIDWGDGSTPVSVSVDNVNDRVSGSEGVLTTAEFTHDAHAYADNGTYTVTVTFSDDDGGTTVETFEVVVNNVAPSLTLTDSVLEINEGETLTIADLGVFSDPGYNNPDNPNGASVESFSYEIDWGDGTPVETGVLPATVVDGSQGVLTTGTLADSHFYADNDADNLYTITVTLTDDDGGSVTQSIVVTVLNVNPTLDPIAATDVSAQGITTLTLTFEDPGADSFEILVDWGDQLSLPPEDRFVVETVYAGDTPETFVLVHQYTGPPNPSNPAEDIVISVKIRDDDFGTPMIVDIGESNLETVAISNPGIGAEPFRIDTTPQVPRLVFPARTEGTFVLDLSNSDEGLLLVAELRSASGDTKSTNERFFELRVISPSGEMSEGIRLKQEVLNDLPGFFVQLTDNHYAIFLVRTETNTRRLVIEFFIRQGVAIDPGDDSDGIRDRPPTDEFFKPLDLMKDGLEEQPGLPDAQIILEPEGETADGDVIPSEISTQIEQVPLGIEAARINAWKSSHRGWNWTPALAAVLAGTASRNWTQDVDRTVAAAEPWQWRRLRRHRPHKRKIR